MNCVNLRVRSKKYQKYFYCTELKKEVSCEECRNCECKEYKKAKAIKGKKHEQTKKTDISVAVKQSVWLRDGQKCIFCGRLVPVSCANAHFIPRSAGGLGIEKNIVTACPSCHHEQDNGLNTQEYDTKAEDYLRKIYKGCWTKDELIYKKRRICMLDGWISLHRKIGENWLWRLKEPFDKRSAWIDLLLSVNHSHTKIEFDNGFIDIEPGQMITSIKKLADKWMWSRHKVSDFLNKLEKERDVGTH